MRRYLNRLLQHFGYEILKTRHFTVNLNDGSNANPLYRTTEITISNGNAAQSAASLPIRNAAAHVGRDVFKWDHYFEVYGRWFSPFMQRENVRVLEIGLFKGASLRIWRKFFHPSAVIVGIDINPECARYENQSENIFVRIGDQADPAFLESLIKEFGPFDIIVDDGSHVSLHQIASFTALYVEGLKDSGVYVVEDTHSNNWEVQRYGHSREDTFLTFAHTLVDRLHEHYDQYLDIRFFQAGRSEQVSKCNVSYFCANTKGVYFADSMVVFEKSARSLPWF